MSGPDVPEWVRDAVFYQIFPDRFARSERVRKPGNLEPWGGPPTRHGYKGGDLWGVVDRLDLLADFGVTALYLNPVFQSASNHRYHTHDYHQVDPMLGGNEALRGLLDAAHDRGMRVVLDGVFNHASRGFFQFSDLLENGPASAYTDWFRIRSFPLNAYGEGEIGYDAWAGLPALPEFDTETDAVREFLFDVGTRWLAFGIDGWRLDVPNEIDDDSFWQEFRRRCREVNSEAYLVGEIWGDAGRWVAGDQFDAVMNYPLGRRIFGFVADDLNTHELARSGWEEIERLGADGAADAVRAELGRYHPDVVASHLNLLGSHDTPRLRTLLCDDEHAVRMAFAMLLTLPGAPCIYYGDEIGMAGGHDPECRAGMPWDRPEDWDEDLRAWIRDLIGLRHARAELRSDAFEIVYASGRVLAYRRGGPDGPLVVVNASPEPALLDWRVGDALREGAWRAAVGLGGFDVAGGRASAASDQRIPARTAAVFLPA